MNRRIIAFALLFLALSGIADAIDITTCSDLNTTNGTYVLTANIAPGSSVCFNFTANNPEISRILTYSITPFLLVMLGSTMVSQKIKLRG